MRSATAIGVLLCVPALAAPVRAGAESGVRHLPPAEASAGEAVSLEATLRSGGWDEIAVRFRAAGGGWRRADFVREGEKRYVARIPAEHVRAPSLEYFLEGRAAGAPAARAVFASAEAPHRLRVEKGEDEERVAEELERYRGRRARLSLSAQLVDYGDRRAADGYEVPDRYNRIDVQFAYRLLEFPLHTLRFGYTRLIGETPRGGRDARCVAGEARSDCIQETGFRVGGWFELGFRLMKGVDVDGRAMVVATQETFRPGGRAEVRIGAADAAHVALGTELILDVGTSGFFRLGWDTVPRLPMAATVEVTDFPASHRDAAVRLLYDVAYPMENGLRLGARLGYQARDEQIGGLTAGGKVSLDF